MPELTTQDLDNAATDALINSLQIKALAALRDRRWILCATLCRALEEIELDRATVAAADSSWRAATRTVPLLNLPMREELPRPVFEATYEYPVTCTRCRKPAHWVPAIETTEPRGWVPAAWVHDDAVLGADHNVEPAPIWSCDQITVHESHEWAEDLLSGVRLYRCPGRTVAL